jgi:nucleoside-diphosphate-sugar epimerase
VKVLVTGANGFLGRHVVAELLSRGHAVRAVVRPASNVASLRWPSSVEIFRADLRTHDLLGAFDDVDVLVHLAATVVGDEDSQLQETVVGTTRLLDAMSASKTKRLVLASSFSVYDFATRRRNLDESSLLERDLYMRDGYAVAKTWQERIVRRETEKNDWNLAVLRPGFIWGTGNEYLAGIGQKIGRFHLIFGPMRTLPLTHVANCAHYFVNAIEKPVPGNLTVNLIDKEHVSAWSYLGRYLRGSGERGIRVPLPYVLCAMSVAAAKGISDLIFHGKGKLPSILVPCRFRARFRPMRYSNDRLESQLKWNQPLTFDEAAARTWADVPQSEANVMVDENPQTVSTAV